MAVYRQIHTTFWQDGFVMDLTPEEKYFYIYLMTNSRTTQCGIYEIHKRVIETETGYNRETVDKLIDRFEEYEKVEYNKETRELMLINWIKYNFIKSTKVMKCIEKELSNIKCKKFREKYYTLCIRYGYPMQRLSIDYGEEEEKEEEVVVDVFSKELKEILFYYEKCGFGLCNDRTLEFLKADIEIYGSEWVKEAMDIAVRANKYKLSYVEAILRNWRADGKKDKKEGKEELYDFSRANSSKDVTEQRWTDKEVNF